MSWKLDARGFSNIFVRELLTEIGDAAAIFIMRPIASRKFATKGQLFQQSDAADDLVHQAHVSFQANSNQVLVTCIVKQVGAT